MLCGAVIEIDEASGAAVSIQRVAELYQPQEKQPQEKPRQGEPAPAANGSRKFRPDIDRRGGRRASITFHTRYGLIFF